MSIRWTLSGPLAKRSPYHYESGRPQYSSLADSPPFNNTIDSRSSGGYTGQMALPLLAFKDYPAEH